MRTWTADAWLAGEPDDVLGFLTDPERIAEWSPIGFELVELDGDRLRTGGYARVRGALAGRALEFDVDVREASEECLALVASGPVEIDVEYTVAPLDRGSELRAAVAVSGRGMVGRLIARATEALLAAGALEAALGRIAARLEPALAVR